VYDEDLYYRVENIGWDKDALILLGRRIPILRMLGKIDADPGEAGMTKEHGGQTIGEWVALVENGSVTFEVEWLENAPDDVGNIRSLTSWDADDLRGLLKYLK
jgi:hypothetical protein